MTWSSPGDRRWETSSILRRATSTAPVPMAASTSVMVSLVQNVCATTDLPVLSPETRSIFPSEPSDNTQHCRSSSWTPKRATKPSPTVPAMSRPTTAAGRAVVRRRVEAAKLLSAANHSTNVAGSRARVTSERSDKLASSERTPTATRRPPRTPLFLDLDARRASRYGAAYASVKAMLPAIWAAASGDSLRMTRKEPRATAGTRPAMAPILAARTPRAESSGS